MVQLLWLLGHWKLEHFELADAEHISEYANRSIASNTVFRTNSTSYGPLSPAGHGHHRCRQTAHCRLLNAGCLGRSQVAYRLHHSEPLFVGNERELHPTSATHLAELHLECCSV